MLTDSAKVVFSGLESSGKSLQLAMTVSDIVYRNIQIYKKFGIERMILSNMKFSLEFEKFLEENHVKFKYWKDLDDLISYDNCDVVIDELGNYFDSRMWSELSLDVRRWLTQGAKSGIQIFGSAQDFAQVDKAFRRLVSELYLITKVIGSPRPSPSMPPVKKIWGLCIMQSLDPQGYNEDDKKFSSSSLIPHFFFIERKYCEIFDTNQKIVRSSLPLLKHIERFCEDPACTLHRHGKIIHV